MSSIYDLLEKGRKLAEESDYMQSSISYLGCIYLMEKDIKLNYTVDKEVECLTAKSEYLWMKSHLALENDDPYFARRLSIFALDLYHKAILLNTDDNKTQPLSDNERLMIKQIILRLNCMIPKNKTHYTLKCPIRIRSFWGVSATSTTVVYKNVHCSICNEPYILCNHKAGEKYEGKTAEAQYSKAEFLDTSLVSKPREPMAKNMIMHIPRSGWEVNIDPKELREEGIYCHYCAAKNIDPDEITYDLFTSMQVPDEEINISKEREIPSEIVNGIDISSLIGKPVYMYPTGSEFGHFPSSVLGEKLKDKKEEENK